MVPNILKSVHGAYTWLPPPSLVSHVLLLAPLCYMPQITTVFSFLCILLEITCVHTSEGCCCEPRVTSGFVTSGGEDFSPGSETRLDDLEFFCAAKFY